MSNAEQCLICLEEFTQDKAYIPELECECAIFVHWACWEPWAGGCLYCRDEYIEYDDEPIIPEQRPIQNYIVNNDLTGFLLKISVAFFTLYFFVLFYHTD